MNTKSNSNAGSGCSSHELFGGFSVAVHSLKTWPQYFERVQAGEKTFEIRKNDRGFQRGDLLLLQEWNPEVMKDFRVGGTPNAYTGRELYMRVTYVTTFEQKEGFVVMGIRPPNDQAMASADEKTPPKKTTL